MSSHLLVFSAASRASLIESLQRFSSTTLGASAAALARMEAGPFRLAIVASSSDEFEVRRTRALEALTRTPAPDTFALAGAVFFGIATDPPAPTAILFPGMGVKQTTLLSDLLARFPFVEDWLDSIRPEDRGPVSGPRTGRLSRPLGATIDGVLLGDLAMWEVLRRVGLKPHAAAGHSYGENAALVAAGVVHDPRPLVEVVSRITRVTGPLLQGARRSLGMLALSAASRPVLDPLLTSIPPRVHLALDNCPRQIVVWGEGEELAQLEAAVKARGEVVFRLGELGKPLHTPLFPMSQPDVRACYNDLPLGETTMDVWSAVSAAPLPPDPDAIRDLLAYQWTRPVRFRELVQRLYDEGIRTFVEVGPGDHLSGFVRDTLRGAGATAIPTNIESRPALTQLQIALAQLFVRGHDLDLSVLDLPEESVEAIVARETALLLGLTDARGLDTQSGFFELGLGSIGCIELVERLERALGRTVPETMPFDYPSVARLAHALSGAADSPAAEPTRIPRSPDGSDTNGDIAIVGMGCRFPGGADSPAAFWKLLVEGTDAVGEVPADRWGSDIPASHSAACLDNIRDFDAAFFGISPREALALDPQQRLLLEVTWEALEHAAINPLALAGTRTGVFVGISNSDYAARLSLSDRLVAGGYLATGNTSSTAAGRLAFTLGTHGPCFALDTACSSSLAAVHQACQSLRSHESDAALAGGVNLIINPETSIFLTAARALSPTGRCRTFDAAADGYVRGEGCGMVVLKRLTDAKASGDTVFAVIRGSAMNHDGRTSGLTVPNGPAQERVVRQALEAARCEPADVTYVEAHGTGTALGDPIEVNALARVFGAAQAKGHRVRLGSVKTNIGHCEAAAGMASLIKVVLQIQHRQLIPSLHFHEPNPRAAWPTLSSDVVTRSEVWEASSPVAGISSFGISGTNVHMIVGEAPAQPTAPGATAVCVLPISARSASSLRAATIRLADALSADPSCDLAAVSRTLCLGRAPFAMRRVVFAETATAAVAALRRLANGAGTSAHESRLRELGTLFESGTIVDWREVHPSQGPRAQLPTYPFDRETYWIDGSAGSGQSQPAVPSETVAVNKDQSIGARVWQAAPEDRAGLVTSYLQAAAGTILGLPEDRPVDPACALNDVGFDSLMGLQLIAAVRRDLDVAIASTSIGDRSSVSSIADAILAAGRSSAVERREDKTEAPLSYGQRALWFLWMVAPENTAYNQSLPLMITEDVNADLWRRAAVLLVQHHPMLRSRFVINGDHPVQRVFPAADINWVATDGRGRSEAGLRAALIYAHAQPFDLSIDAPIRFNWVTHSDTRAVLLITMHHIACDAWSMEILRQDLGAFARALKDSPSWTPARPSHTYQDFVEWQRHLLQGAEGARLWTHWQTTLAEPRAQLDLPTDRPRPALPSFRGDSVHFPIDATLVDAVRTRARAGGVTPFVLLMATYLVVLYRWTRQPDVVIGTLTAGRTQPEFSNIVGYFVDPVVIRTRLEDGGTFADLLEETSRTTREALAHADFPFALLVERLRVDRDPSRSPIFDVTFNFVSRRAIAHSAAGKAAPQPAEIPQADGKFDLTLSVIEDEASMTASLGFATDLFDRATIARVGEWFTRVLAAVCADPSLPIDRLPMSEAAAATPALVGRAIDEGTLRPVHEQIAEQARRQPTTTAVVAEDGRLSYGELAMRAEGVAAWLVSQGVGPDVPVGLCTTRSVDFVVGLLGIFQAGGAYVPLDPGLPDDVRRHMLERSGATICLGNGLPLPVAVPSSTPIRVTTMADRAYIIFTSGSTGEPKGVEITHRALSNYVASIVDDLQITSVAQHACVSTIGADLGHTAIFPALVTGGTLHLVSEDTSTDRHLFARYLTTHSIDYLKIVPSHLAALCSENEPVLPRRAVFLGGESSNTAWVRELAQRSGTRVFNHYGPTETTVGVMTYAFDPSHAPATATLPLARVVANSAVWLLDSAQQPVVQGVPGEMYVSGACLARGYVNDPARTAERFVTLEGGIRAYRTGDLARQLSDGSLHLRGRADRQLKLRGYRVEPGQVEGALRHLPGVSQAVVLPDRDDAKMSTLIAWIVPSSASIDIKSVQQALSAALPAYMVPSRVLIVDRLPLNANGKLDTAALRRDLAPVVAGAAPCAPTDEVEVRLQEIWAQALGSPRVGRDDDFFELGGHSLLAVRVASRIFDELGVRVPITTLFTHRTIASLAAFVRQPKNTAPGPLVSLNTGGDGPTVILFPGAGGSLLYFTPLLSALGSDLSVWGADAIGLADGQPIPASIPQLAREYVNAIEQACGQGVPCLAGHSFGALVAYEVARQLEARGRRVASVIAIDNPAPGLLPATTHESWGAAQRVRHIAMRVERLYGVNLDLDDSRGPTDTDASAWLADRLREAGALPEGSSSAYVARYVDLYCANVRAVSDYAPSAIPLHAPIVVIKARDTDAVLEMPRGIAPDFGWGAFSSSSSVTTVAGTHITMLNEPHVRELARTMLHTIKGLD